MGIRYVSNGGKGDTKKGKALPVRFSDLDKLLGQRGNCAVGKVCREDWEEGSHGIAISFCG
jgi:hypothetical protein